MNRRVLLVSLFTCVSMNQYIRGTHTLTFSSHLDSDSDRQPIESEEDMEDPYPLEGKYKDDADKRE